MSLIDPKNIVVKEKDREVLRLVTIDFKGVKNFKDNVLYEATGNHNIVHYSSSHRNLYVLLCGKNGSNFTLESHYLDEVSNQLTLTGVIKDVSTVNSSFVNEF